MTTLSVTTPQPYGHSLVGPLPEDLSREDLITEVAQQLRAQGATVDVDGVVFTHTRDGETYLALLSGDSNPFGFDADRALRMLGWEIRVTRDPSQPLETNSYTGQPNHPAVSSEVTWDPGAAISLIGDQDRQALLEIWPEGRPNTRVVLLDLMLPGDYIRSLKGEDVSASTWAVIVNGRLAGITDDPTIIQSVRDGELTNLDGLSLPATTVRIPVTTVLPTGDITRALADIELHWMDTLGVDSGQMMIIDSLAANSFEDNEPSFDREDNSLSYAGACSVTVGHNAYGGVLVHEDVARAGVSSSGYGDGSYPAYVGKNGDLVLVSFLAHEFLTIGSESEDEEDEEEVDFLFDPTQTLDTSKLVTNAERLEWIDGGTFVVGSDDADGTGMGSVLVADPCYLSHEGEIQGLLTDVIVREGTYQLVLGIHNRGKSSGWESDRVSVLLAYRVD